MFHKKLKDSPQFVAGDKTLLREIMHPQKDAVDTGYSIAQASVEVGQASLPHQLKSSECYYILAGEGRMHIEDTTFEVSKDDVFLVPANAQQHIENTGLVPLVFLCIVEPYWQEEDEMID